MIISASRRTDLPAFYPEETVRKIMQIHLEQKPVNAVVFWTKNAEPIIPYLDILTEAKIPFYFQYTINNYPSEYEPGIPYIMDRIKTFKKLSELFGKERVIWRYDPIFLAPKISVGNHLLWSSWIAYELKDHTNRGVFSFFDPYFKLTRTEIRPPAPEQEKLLYDHFAAFAEDNRYKHIKFSTCAELQDPKGPILPGKCIDPEILKEIGATIPATALVKDPSQRKRCGCIKSLDIGQYHTCKHGCQYCYAR